MTTCSIQDTEYLNFWLRDNCQCKDCYDHETYQRLLNTFEIDTDIHPLKIDHSESAVCITWSDNHTSCFSKEWLESHRGPKKDHNAVLHPRLVLWGKDTISRNLPVVDYKDVTEGRIADLFNNTHRYGFTYIQNVPVDTDATEKLCKQILPIRHTHYGGFWDFTTDLTMKDTAYSDLEILSHTDGTYWEYTPYLQLFHLLYHDGTGGETTLVDSFHCVEIMRKEFPDEWKTLKTLPIECHSLGDVHLVQRKPVFIYDERDELVQVSWNNCDRSTNYHLSIEEQKLMYKAMARWFEVINRPENLIWKQLKPGEVLLFNNWRILHSRMGKTTGKRRMCGVYFDRDDFFSTLRKINSGDEQKLFEEST